MVSVIIVDCRRNKAKFGSLMWQLGANLPRNAEVEKNEAGREEQKLSIGGKSHYCS
jgi:hypothetical protein